MANQPFQAKVIYGIQTSSPSPCSMIIEGYLNRARELAHRQNYSRAIIELREAIDTYPNSALCHSRLSCLYFKAEQKTMARIHAKRALALDPTNQIAIKIQQKLSRQEVYHSNDKPTQAAPNEAGIRGFFAKKIF